jgi:predicted permease
MIDRVLRAVRRLRHYFRRDRFESDFTEELAFHLDQKTEELERAGHPRLVARRLAGRRLGNRGVIQQDAREVWAVRWWDALRRDGRVALRGLRRTRGFTVAALLTLALGIGGTVTIFSLVHAALLSPLPYPDPDRLVNLHLIGQDASHGRFLMPWPYPKYAQARELADFADGVAGFNPTSVNLRGPSGPERIVLEEVSASYFPILGARTVLGRVFWSSEDSVPNGNALIVLSHSLWRRRFGADSAIIGRAISVAGVPFTVIGVLTPRFRSLSGPVDAWVPLTMSPSLEYPEILSEAGNHWIGVVARLRPEVELARADQAMGVIGRRIDADHRMKTQTGEWSGTAQPLRALRIDPTIKRATLVLMAAVGSLLLIACANVASLLLVRAEGRRRELAIRSAVGAGPRVLMRQLLVESLILSLAGGLAGVVAARVGVAALGSLNLSSDGGPGGLSYLFDVGGLELSPPVLGFAVGITVLTGLLVGLMPARRVLVPSAIADLKGDRRLTFSRGLPVQQGLIGLEAALAVVLLIGAGLMMRSFSRLSSVDVGFQAESVLTVAVSPAEPDLASREPVNFKVDALARLRAIPGVTAAGTNGCAPLTGRCSSSVVVDRPGQLGGGDIGVHYVDDQYFTALRIPLRAGRNFGREDRPGSGRVVIVNETAARRLWPGQDPIGKELSVATGYFAGGDSTARVVGVVGDVRYQDADVPADLDVYLPALQRSFGRALFFVRTTGDPRVVIESVRSAIREADPGLPIHTVRTLADIAAAATARTRLLTVILGVFSLLALTLAAVGVYGVVAFAMRTRAKEISIRLALGANPSRLVGLLVGQSAVPVVVGVVVGAAAAVGLTRLVRGLLFEVDPRDAISFGSGVALLAVAGLVASWLPARRATRTDLLTPLKTDG